MIVIPTVEIRNGVCVPPASSGHGGDPLHDPVAVARGWAAEGFTRVHVVDYDAVNGIGSNASLIEDVIRDGGIDVQANGGVQSTDGVQRLVDAGAFRVVLGTRAIAESGWLAAVVELNPGMLIVETALRDRHVVVRGWGRSTPLDIFDVIEEMDGLPLAGLLVTAQQADGQRGVPELSLLEEIADACEYPLLASGGVLAVSDLRALEHRRMSAVVVTGALFTGETAARAVAEEFRG